jgi:hypothetical protein
MLLVLAAAPDTFGMPIPALALIFPACRSSGFEHGIAAAGCSFDL